MIILLAIKDPYWNLRVGILKIRAGPSALWSRPKPVMAARGHSVSPGP